MTDKNEADFSMPMAAIDLGSNSFHMIVARVEHGQLVIIDRIRDMVQLASGLDKQDNLSEAVVIRALDCLTVFKQRLKHIAAENIIAVGTNTFRRVQNNQHFLERAEYALGHSIGIISGHEEARLVFLGVSHTNINNDARSLVIDIGGGSTEIIIGEKFEPLYMESLFFGCVSLTQSCFKKDIIKPKHFDQAEIKIMLALSPYIAQYKRLGWQEAVGSSGTIRAISKVLLENGWTDGTITLDGLERIKQTILKMGNVTGQSLPGLSEHRTSVFVGGVAILSAIFKRLEIDKMQVSMGAVREGLLYDLLGRTQNHDVRDMAIKRLITRFNCDGAHLEKVQQTAANLLSLAAEQWPHFSPSDAIMLSWAASLHEIGLSISHDHYQKHGAYMIDNMDLIGFTRQEQNRLSLLVRYQRKRICKDIFKQFAKPQRQVLLRLILLFRLAVLLRRSRSPEPLTTLQLMLDGKKIKLTFPDKWLATHPLTEADLSVEAKYLREIGWELTVK